MKNEHIITFNAMSFLKDAHIEHTNQGQKATKNRVQVHCPFCTGSRKYHLGIHLTHGYANCWRCGPHSILSTITKLLHVSWSEAYKIIDEYKDVGNVKVVKSSRIINENVKIPCVLEPLKDRHKKYIADRDFDVDNIVSTWGVQSTGPLSIYKHRIFIPIFYRGEIVSYQCRYTGNDEDVSRYLTCKPTDEKVFHKSILYGLDNAVSDTIVVVEGATDAWRLGPGAVATFGTNYMPEQVYQISKYKYVYLLFDPEKTAAKQGEKLGNELAFLNCEVELLDMSSTGYSDPGSMSQDDANGLMADIFRGTL